MIVGHPACADAHQKRVRLIGRRHRQGAVDADADGPCD
jgi:hypothetical protein